MDLAEIAKRMMLSQRGTLGSYQPTEMPWGANPPVAGEMDRRIGANMDWQRGYAAPVPGPYDVVNPAVSQALSQRTEAERLRMQLQRLGVDPLSDMELFRAATQARRR